MAQGRRSPGDILRSWEHRKPPKYGPHDHLQTSCCMQFAIHACGSETELSKKFYGEKDASGLVSKWLHGTHVLSRNSAENLEECAPGVLALYDLPLWALLENRPMGLKEIDRLTAPFRVASKWLFWSFPNDDELIATHRYGGVMVRDDVDGLFQRGDVYGFTAIVAAVRASESEGDPDHSLACAFMYRALPSIYKLPWIVSQRKQLESCLKALRGRVWMSYMNFDIDWDVIDRQTADPLFEPKRELRKREPITRRFQTLEDPILYAEWIPGAEAKRLRLLKEAAAERRRAKRLNKRVKI